MPKKLFKLSIAPGFNKDDTDYSAGPSWVDGDKVRFHRGRPQKIQGWTNATDYTFDGIARAIVGWRATSDEFRYIAIGTDKKLYIWVHDTYTDITPLRTSGTLGANPITTTDTSTTVSIEHAGHGLVVGDIVIFDGASEVNNITVDGEYSVVEITDTNNYTITDTETADGSGAGGGSAVTFKYLIHIGPAEATAGLGYGAGRYNIGAWNTEREATASNSDIIIELGTWTLDLWGEDLIACPRGGANIYSWDLSAGTGTRAASIANAPASNFIQVSVEDRHLIALGTTVAGESTINPLHVRWSDQEDNTDWSATATNTAGSHLLTDGNQIIGAIRAAGQNLIFTDSSLFSMQFIGPDDTFGFSQLGTECGLIGPHAAAQVGNVVFWMGPDNFYAYDGTVRALRSSVYDYVYKGLNFSQKDQVFAGQVSSWEEIWWFYCSSSATECDSYVIYNYGENIWYTGTLDRSVWLETGQVDAGLPFSADYSGQLYIQESGVDAAGGAITSFIETGEFELTEGDEYLFVDRLIPDIELTGDINFTLKLRPYPAGTETSKGPYTLTTSTTKQDLRARGRQLAVRFESSSVGDNWRLGDQRLRVRPEGRN